jgi:hypothetical protein
MRSVVWGGNLALNRVATAETAAHRSAAVFGARAL